MGQRTGIVVVALVLAAIVALALMEWHLDLPALEAWIEERPLTGAAIYVFVLAGAVVVMPLSSLPFVPLAARVYGVPLTGALSATGCKGTARRLAFVFGVGAAFDAPARQAFVSEMVGPEDVPNAIGLNSTAFNSARLVGPGLAGLLIAALGGGMTATGWVIVLNAVSYLAVIAQLQRMDPRALRSPRIAARRRGMLREGVRYIRTQPKMVAILVMVFFVGTFGMNFTITSALMATETYGKGAGEFGVLGSALAVGSLSGALLGARRTPRRLRLLLGAGAG
jgi:hypothetical protein